MKLVIAYIRPERLPEVRQALYAHEVFGMSAMNVMGSGLQRGLTSTYRGVKTEGNLLPKVRLEVGVNDDFLDKAIEAIRTGAHTGREGDGMIFVTDIAYSVRVRTGETNVEAVRGNRTAP